MLRVAQPEVRVGTLEEKPDKSLPDGGIHCGEVTLMKLTMRPLFGIPAGSHPEFCSIHGSDSSSQNARCRGTWGLRWPRLRGDSQAVGIGEPQLIAGHNCAVLLDRPRGRWVLGQPPCECDAHGLNAHITYIAKILSGQRIFIIMPFRRPLRIESPPPRCTPAHASCANRRHHS